MLLVVVGIVYGVSLPGSSLLDTIINIVGTATIAIMPWALYYVVLKKSCECVVWYRENDGLTLSDEELVYYYHPNNVRDNKVYQQYGVKYDEVREIIYNTYHNRVDIYSRYQKRFYSDFEKGKYVRKKNVNRPDSRVRIYMHFDNNEEILRILEEKTKVKIQTIACPQEQREVNMNNYGKFEDRGSILWRKYLVYASAFDLSDKLKSQVDDLMTKEIILAVRKSLTNIGLGLVKRK